MIEASVAENFAFFTVSLQFGFFGIRKKEKRVSKKLVNRREGVGQDSGDSGGAYFAIFSSSEMLLKSSMSSFAPAAAILVGGGRKRGSALARNKKYIDSDFFSLLLLSVSVSVSVSITFYERR